MFKELDIPLTCSIFLEPALKKHRRFIAPVSNTTEKYIHEWNQALLSVIRQPNIRERLGDVGHKVLNNTLKSKDFPAKCVDAASDVNLQSLHYAIRFSESMNFLTSKLSAGKNISFVDFGCGFSPLVPAIQAEYNINTAYCVDMPGVIDVYNQVANLVAGHAPTAISWEDIQNLSRDNKLNTIVSMGVFPSIKLTEQIEKLKFINKHLEHFMVEIKYSNNLEDAEKNVFNLKKLQKLKMDVEDTGTLETAMIRNSLRYLHNFISAMPNKKYFLESNRSLFLSR